jgi:hypothetical protein
VIDLKTDLKVGDEIITTKIQSYGDLVLPPGTTGTILFIEEGVVAAYIQLDIPLKGYNLVRSWLDCLEKVKSVKDEEKFPYRYRERQLKHLLTGTTEPADYQWSTALERLINHLELNPVPSPDETSIQFDIPEELLLRSAINAHNQGTTLNQYITNAIKALLEELENKTDVQNPK